MCILGHLLSILFILSCLFNLGKMNIVVHYVIQCWWWYLCPLFNFVARQSIRETRQSASCSTIHMTLRDQNTFHFHIRSRPKIQACPHRTEQTQSTWKWKLMHKLVRAGFFCAWLWHFKYLWKKGQNPLVHHRHSNQPFPSWDGMSEVVFADGHPQRLNYQQG